MLIFAHRGASKAAPENTVKAFKLAFEQRADGIEFDTYQHESGIIVSVSYTHLTLPTKRIV